MDKEGRVLNGLIEIVIAGRRLAVIEEAARIEKPWPEDTPEYMKRLFNPPEDIEYVVEDIETGARGIVKVDAAEWAEKLHTAKIAHLQKQHPGLTIEPIEFDGQDPTA